MGGTMIQTASIKKALRALRTQESVLQAQLEKVRETTSHLIRMTEGKVNLTALGRSGGARSGPERLSAKGRAAISRAAKRRWAEYRRQQAAAQQGKLNQTG
jgi:hypothetical protein